MDMSKVKKKKKSGIIFFSFWCRFTDLLKAHMLTMPSLVDYGILFMPVVCFTYILTSYEGKTEQFLIMLCALVSARQKSRHVVKEGAGVGRSHW